MRTVRLMTDKPSHADAKARTIQDRREYYRKYYRDVRRHKGRPDFVIPVRIYDKHEKEIPIRTSSQWDSSYAHLRSNYLKRSRQVVILRATHWEVT